MPALGPLTEKSFCKSSVLLDLWHAISRDYCPCLVPIQEVPPPRETFPEEQPYLPRYQSVDPALPLIVPSITRRRNILLSCVNCL